MRTAALERCPAAPAARAAGCLGWKSEPPLRRALCNHGLHHLHLTTLHEFKLRPDNPNCRYSQEQSAVATRFVFTRTVFSHAQCVPLESMLRAPSEASGLVEKGGNARPSSSRCCLRMRSACHQPAGKAGLESTAKQSSGGQPRCAAAKEAATCSCVAAACSAPLNAEIKLPGWLWPAMGKAARPTSSCHRATSAKQAACSYSTITPIQHYCSLLTFAAWTRRGCQERVAGVARRIKEHAWPTTAHGNAKQQWLMEGFTGGCEGCCAC